MSCPYLEYYLCYFLRDFYTVNWHTLIKGYTKSSTILEDRYTHLVDGDRVAAFLESEGLETPTVPEPEQLEDAPEPIVCPRCEFENDGRL